MGSCFAVKNGYGTKIYENRNYRYKGNLVNYYENGKGISQYWNYRFGKWKDLYDGNWTNGKYDGYGKLYGYDNRFIPYIDVVYEGSWKNGLYHGNGKENYYTNNRLVSSYEGEWKNGRENGKGVYTIYDGQTYEGFWVNGKKNGQITYKNSYGEHISTWKYGEPDIENSFYITNKFVLHIYELLTNGRYRGTIKYDNDDSYDGEVEYQSERFIRSGKGVFKSVTGEQYDGLWEKDSACHYSIQSDNCTSVISYNCQLQKILSNDNSANILPNEGM